MDVKLSSILLSILTIPSITFATKILFCVWFRPKKLERFLRKQGLERNPYRLFIGDTKDFIKVMKTEQRKTINLSDDLPPHIHPFHHNIIHKYDLSGDVISRTAFGSSHEEGRRIFELQKEQVKLLLQLLQFSFIPGWRYFPTKANRRLKTIAREIQFLLRGIITQRERATEKGEIINEDLLGILMECNVKEIQEHGNKDMGLTIEDVIGECKLFYFAGSETTSNLLVGTMIMLSKYQDWQARGREEILQVFGKKEPSFDGLNQLKTVTMILHEVLRMYPPAPLLFRVPTKTVKLGSMTLPVGAQLTLLIGLMHHDPKIWGDDVKEFKPERFSEGISSAAKAQFSSIPFGSGPRVCVGQNFAMIEAKMALAMILQHFSFELSPSYQHAPFPIMTLQPQYGAPLILHKLQSPAHLC